MIDMIKSLRNVFSIYGLKCAIVAAICAGICTTVLEHIIK